MPSLHMDPPKKSISQMKHDKKCSSRRLARDVSMSNSSVEELYEGKSAAIPFTWESQPGTPKIKFREAPLPPLTPPPSYYYKATSKRPMINKHSKPRFLNNIFTKRNGRNVSSSTGYSSSSSSPTSSFSSSPCPSSYSVPSSPMTPSRFCRRGGRISASPRMSYDCSAGDGDNDEYRETISTLCFGVSPWSKIIGSKAVIRV